MEFFIAEARMGAGHKHQKRCDDAGETFIHRSRSAARLLSRCQRRGPERIVSTRTASLHMEDGPMMMKIIDLLILILRLVLVILDQPQ